MIKITFAALGIAALAVASHFVRKTTVIVNVNLDVSGLLEDMMMEDDEEDIPGDKLLGNVRPLTPTEWETLTSLDFPTGYTEQENQ